MGACTAPVGLFIRAEVRIKHPHFCCVSKQLQGSEINLQIHPGADPWGPEPSPARGQLLLLCTKGNSAGSQHHNPAQSRGNSIPQLIFSLVPVLEEGTGDPHPLDAAGPWLFVHPRCSPPGLGADPAPPSTTTAPGTSPVNSRPTELPLPTLPAVCCAQERAGVGEMKQNRSIALTLLFIKGSHGPASKHPQGSVGKTGSTGQFTLQLLPYLLQALSHASWSSSYLPFKPVKMCQLYIYILGHDPMGNSFAQQQKFCHRRHQSVWEWGSPKQALKSGKWLKIITTGGCGRLSKLQQLLPDCKCILGHFVGDTETQSQGFGVTPSLGVPHGGRVSAHGMGRDGPRSVPVPGRARG